MAKLKGTLTLITSIPSFTQLVYFIKTGCNKLQRIHHYHNFHIKAKHAKFDIAFLKKTAQSQPMFTFEQTLVGLCTRCYKPSFVEIDPLVPGKYKGCLPYMDKVLTNITIINAYLLVPESLHTNSE